MTNHSERSEDRLAVWVRSPRGSALLAALLTLSAFWLLGSLIVGAYRTQLLSGGSVTAFEVNGLIWTRGVP